MVEETKQQNIEIIGANQWNYLGTDGSLDTPFTLELAFPVKEAGTEGKFKFKTLPAFNCLSVTHRGSWDTLKDLYETTIPEMISRGMTLTGNCREIYLQVSGPNSSENVTEVQIEYI